MKKLVYLDSSDYSKFADPTNAVGQQVFRHIKRLQKSGKYEFRYSGVHVLEMTQTEYRYLPLASARLRVLEQLCDGKCFPMLKDLTDLETASFEKNGSIQRVDLLRNNNEYLGSYFDEALDADTISAIKTLREMTKDISARRQASIDLGFRGLVLSRDDIIRHFIEQNLIGNHTLATDILRNCIKRGTASWCTPTLFSRITADAQNSGEGNLRQELVEDMARLINHDFAEERSRLKHLMGPSPSFEKWDAVLSEEFSDMEKGWYDELGPDFGDPPPSLRTDNKFSMKTLMVLTEWYCRNFILPFEGKPKGKPSDALDLFHLIYLPYVDIFRVDNDMSPLAREIAKDTDCIVIDKIGGLLDLNL